MPVILRPKIARAQHLLTTSAVMPRYLSRTEGIVSTLRAVYWSSKGLRPVMHSGDPITDHCSRSDRPNFIDVGETRSLMERDQLGGLHVQRLMSLVSLQRVRNARRTHSRTGLRFRFKIDADRPGMVRGYRPKRICITVQLFSPQRLWTSGSKSQSPTRRGVRIGARWKCDTSLLCANRDGLIFETHRASCLLSRSSSDA
jgi:hypothetical protein